MAPQRAVVISLVVAISATAMALFALGKRGAFDANDGTAPGPQAAQPQTASASETTVRALEPHERAEALPVAAPAAAEETSSNAQLE